MLRKLILIILLLAAQHAFAADPQKFLSISDIHFDPFSGCHVVSLKPCTIISQLRAAPAQDWAKIFESSENKNESSYGSDTNYFLLKSSLAQVSGIILQENPRFAFVLGDFLAHNYRGQYVLYSHDTSTAGYHSFVKKTFQFMTQQLRQAIPDIDIYPAMGNNDSYEDYEYNPAVLHDNAQTWSAFFKDKTNKENFQHDFSADGFYAVNLPTDTNQRILVLNTVLFASRAQGKNIDAAAARQLSWLHKQLEKAKQENHSVILAFHIPMGVDVYRTLQSFLGGIKEFWKPEYNDAFNKELQEFSGTITAILPGHIHMDSFQIFAAKKQSDIPVSFTPSISPIFGNNPAFKIYSYDPATLQVQNYETYYYPLTDTPRVWQKEYTFNKTYQSACENCNVANGMKNLKPQGGAANFFKEYYAVGTDTQKITKDHFWMPFYWCNIYAFSAQAYLTCIQH